MPNHEAKINTQPVFKDEFVECVDCKNEFIWTEGEQHFFHDKGLKNPPKRCKECKQAKNDRIAMLHTENSFGKKQKIEVKVNCTNCNLPTTVPFYPSQGRPVFCRSCFLKINPDILKSD